MQAKINYENYLLEILEVCESGDQIIQKLEAVTAEGHDAMDHEYQESEEFPGTCAVCGWIHPDTMVKCSCGRSLREHVLQLISISKELINISQLESEIDQMFEEMISEKIIMPDVVFVTLEKKRIFRWPFRFLND